MSLPNVFFQCLNSPSTKPISIRLLDVCSEERWASKAITSASMTTSLRVTQLAFKMCAACFAHSRLVSQTVACVVHVCEHCVVAAAGCLYSACTSGVRRDEALHCPTAAHHTWHFCLTRVEQSPHTLPTLGICGREQHWLQAHRDLVWQTLGSALLAIWLLGPQRSSASTASNWE